MKKCFLSGEKIELKIKNAFNYFLKCFFFLSMLISVVFIQSLPGVRGLDGPAVRFTHFFQPSETI